MVAINVDLLQGAADIADFLFGDTGERRRNLPPCRKIEASGISRIGVTLCARKSALVAWIEAQEAAASRADSA